MNTYLIDTNVFIEAKNRYYKFDFCPAFWDWLILKNKKGKVFSIGKVFDEINKYKDNLSQWINKEGKNLFLTSDEGLNLNNKDVITWMDSKKYEFSVKNNFVKTADYHLVLEAHINHRSIVTHEMPSNSLKKIKIPDVCKALGIKCITPFQMLQLEKAHFVLGNKNN